MKKLFFLTLACGGAMLLNGAELKLQSAADGMLIDRNGDGVVESVLTHTQEKPVLELLTGKLGNGIHRSVLEYKLPEKSAVAKATLTVTLNGRTGCHPDTPGIAGPKTVLWVYWGTEADGKIGLADDGAGEKAGVILPNRAADLSRPVVVDVTEQLKKAVAAGAGWIGFRLEAADEKNAAAAWRIRSSEFARRYAASSLPVLTIVTEQGGRG